LGATAGIGVPVACGARAPSEAVGVGVGFCGDDLGGGALGATGTGALGALGAGAGFGAAGRGPVPTTGIFFTSGRCADEGERDDDGALAALGALFAAGAAGRGAPGAEGGAFGTTSSASAAATSLGASIAGGGSLPGSASPMPGTLETWIT